MSEPQNAVTGAKAEELEGKQTWSGALLMGKVPYTKKSEMQTAPEVKKETRKAVSLNRKCGIQRHIDITGKE